jgi:hypothetical protein
MVTYMNLIYILNKNKTLEVCVCVCVCVCIFSLCNSPLKTMFSGWGHSSVIGHLSSMGKVWVPSPALQMNKQNIIVFNYLNSPYANYQKRFLLWYLGLWYDEATLQVQTADLWGQCGKTKHHQNPNSSRKECVYLATPDKISPVSSKEDLETLTRTLCISFIAYYINILYMFKFTVQ